MGKKEKWLGEVEPGHAISEVARQAIAARSEQMLQFLPLAANQWKEDVEYVHNLRTWSRRTQSALQLFASLLPLKRSTALRKGSQKLRKSAGDARDLDVFIKRVRKTAFEFCEGEKEKVLSFLRTLRKDAQPQLIKANAWAAEENLAREFQKLIDRVRWREVSEEESLEMIAPTFLEPMIVRFFHFSQHLSEAPESLHQMRIEGKKARYAMELVECGFPASFREELYPEFEQVQSKLGTINDHHTAVEKIQRWQSHSTPKKFPPALLRMAEYEQAKFDTKAAAFRAWWAGERAERLKQHFDRFLGGLGMPVGEP